MIETDAIIYHMFGPLEVMGHDMMLFRDSKIEPDLKRSSMIYGNTILHLWWQRDSTYVLGIFIQTQFQGTALTDEQHHFHTETNRLRTSIE